MNEVKAMMFHGLEINQRMQKRQSEDEIVLWRHIRKHYANRVLANPADFAKVVEEIQRHTEAINMRRRGVGPYLCVDSFAPTDITFGWVRVHYATEKCQARMSVSHTEGEITLID